jgi:hypothetical protein
MRWLLLVAASLQAQSDYRYSFSAGDEVSYAAGLRVPAARAGNLGLVQGSLSFRSGDRWRFASSAAALAVTEGDTHARLRVKETYAGLTLGDFDLRSSSGARAMRSRPPACSTPRATRPIRPTA